MKERDETQASVVLGPITDIFQQEGLSGQVAMGENGAERLPRQAGGIYHYGRVVTSDLRHLKFEGIRFHGTVYGKIAVRGVGCYQRFAARHPVPNFRESFGR